MSEKQAIPLVPVPAEMSLPAVLPPPLERPVTFAALVQQLVLSDDLLAHPEFDPAALVEDLKTKVDALAYVEHRMEVVSQQLAELAKPIAKKATAIAKNRDRLRDYIASVMAAEKFSEIPGNKWKVVLRTSNPSWIVRDATPKDCLDFPGLVRVHTTYAWEKDKIKDAIKNQQPLPANLPGSLEPSYRPDFVPNVPEELERKPKGRSKKK